MFTQNLDIAGIAKVELALGEGKTRHDKRETIKRRDWQPDKARLMREKGQGGLGWEKPVDNFKNLKLKKKIHAG